MRIFLINYLLEARRGRMSIFLIKYLLKAWGVGRPGDPKRTYEYIRLYSLSNIFQKLKEVDQEIQSGLMVVFLIKSLFKASASRPRGPNKFMNIFLIKYLLEARGGLMSIFLIRCLFKVWGSGPGNPKMPYEYITTITRIIIKISIESALSQCPALSLSLYIYIYIYIHMNIYLSIFLSLSIHLSIYLSIYLFVYPSIYPSSSLSLSLSSVYLSIYLSIYLSFYVSIYLSIYLYHIYHIHIIYTHRLSSAARAAPTDDARHRQKALPQAGAVQRARAVSFANWYSV